MPSATRGAVHHPEPLSKSDLALLEELTSISAGELSDNQRALLSILRKLHDHVFRDELTGLLNRKALHRDSRFHHLRQPTGRRFVFMIDINDFKQYNTRYGHAGGDAVLRHVAAILGQSARSKDGVYRWAGDEFCVIAYDATPYGAKRLAHRLWRSVRETPVAIGSNRVTATIAIGFAEVTATIDRAMRQADRALYRAKDGKATGKPTVWGEP